MILIVTYLKLTHLRIFYNVVPKILEERNISWLAFKKMSLILWLQSSSYFEAQKCYLQNDWLISWGTSTNRHFWKKIEKSFFFYTTSVSFLFNSIRIWFAKRKILMSCRKMWICLLYNFDDRIKPWSTFLYYSIAHQLIALFVKNVVQWLCASLCTQFT